MTGDQQTERPPSDSIELIEHQLTREEVVPLYYWQVSRRSQFYLLPAVGLVFLVAGAVVLAADPSNQVAWVVLITLGFVIVVIFALLVPLTPNRIWKRVRRQFEVRTLRVSEEGIRRITAGSDSLMRWSMFSTTTERNQMYILQHSGGPGLFMIPRRAFASESDELVFRGLAERLTTAHLQPDRP